MNNSINKNNNTRASSFKRGLAACALGFASLLPVNTFAHNVGQVQTTIYFAPETTALLASRAAAGGGVGFVAGDIISYIISFQPVPNPGAGANTYASTGVNGYITDYIPSNTQVVGASFVQADGTTLTTPNLPGPMVEAVGVNVFTAPYLTTLMGALPDLYAETGIFYSSDPRTTLDPTTVGTGNIAKQGLPGYYVNPTRGAALAALIDPAIITMATHNLWDADQTNAFGTTTPPATLPKSNATQIILNGSGMTPLNAGSPVAGPDSGYKLDNTGFQGPWQRIYAPGSTIGCANGCVGLAAANIATTSVRATPTSQGVNVSTASPLPTSVNAVRWAAGQLIVGQPRYVKISVKLLANPPATGLLNSAEVSGGDSDGSTSRDNPWTYWVASAANNNSNLFIQKSITNVCTFAQNAALTVGQNASNCPAYTGGNIPPNATLRYVISYNNLSNSTQHQVVLSDLLPLETNVPPAAPATPATLAQLATLVKNFVYTGYNLSAPAPTFTAGTATTSAKVSFAPISSLGPALGGTIAFDVSVSTPTVPQTVSNVAKITTFEIPAGSTAAASANVLTAPAGDVTITKTALSANVAPGGTASYTITLTNNGSSAATMTNVIDTLPGSGTATGVAATDALTRFTYVGPSSFTNGAGAATAITGTAAVPAAAAPNKQVVTFAFPAATLLAAGQKLVLTINSTVGANTPTAGSPYTNTVTSNYTGGAVGAIMPTFTGSPVTVGSGLTISKVLDCVYDVAAICQPYLAGTPLPLNAKVRYKISYANTSVQPMSNVYICDEIASTQTAPLFNLSTINNAPIANSSVLSNGFAVTPTLPVAPPAAIAACGFAAAATNKINFNYPVINPLDAGQAGIVYYEATTNVPINPAATAVTLTNTAKIISSPTVTGPAAASATGATSTPVSATGANLVVSKAAAVPVGNPAGHAYGGDLVNYTITVTNTGNTATGASTAAAPLKVVDTLPGSGAVNSLPLRFTYLPAPIVPGAAPSYKIGAGAATPFATAPTVVVTAATNSEAVTFTLPVGTIIPAGGTITITFTAQVGTAVPALATSYNNSAIANYLNGATAATSPALVGAAPVLVDPALQATKTIDCIYDPLPATTCTPYVAGAQLPVNYTTATTTKVRYKIAYVNNAPTAIPFVFICDQISSAQAAPVFTSPLTAVVTPASTAAPNGPSATTITTPLAVAACGYGAVAAGKVQANFAVITSLAAKAAGVVYLDAATNIASGATLSNDAKLVSATLATGTVASTTVLPSAISTAAATAGTANLVVSKTVDKPASYGGDAVRYTISVTNTGLAPATMGSVVDTLPGSGTGDVISARFTYTALPAPAAINNGVATAVPVGVVTVPGVAPALNEEKVTFTITPAAVILPGKTLTLSFTATVGLNVTPSATAYTNDALVNYTGGAAGVVSSSVLGAAPVTVGSNPLTINKSIACVYDATVPTPICQPYVAGAQLPLNAKIRYKIDYANTSAAPIANVYLCDKISSTQAAPLFNLSTVANAPIANTAVMSGGIAVTPTLPAAPVPAAIAACGFGVVATSAQTFNYPLINPLDANQAGTVYYEATTNAANGANVNNLVSIITAAVPTAAAPTTSNTTAVSATVVPAPVLTANFVVTKAVAVPVANTAGHAYGGNLVTYTITVKNTGAAAGVLTSVADTLPPGAAVAALANAATRFSYAALPAPSYINGAGVATAFVTVPAVTYLVNSEVVTFTFPAPTSIAANTSLTLTFTALVGATTPPSPAPYTNSATANYTGGPVGVLAATVTGTAPVVVDSPLTATKTIDCVYDLLGVCQAYTGTGTIPVFGSSATTTKVRYKIAYANLSPTAIPFVFICDQLSSTQAAPVFTAPLTTPTTAPNPVGPFTNTAAPNGPSAALPAVPPAAVAACGVTPVGAVAFNYPVITSLAANATGVVYFDANANVASAATLSNTAKLVSATLATGTVATAIVSNPSTAAAYAVNAPNLVITKATTTPSLGPNGTATYTITVKNTGNAATSTLKVYDFLPFSGAVVDVAKQFTHFATTALTGTPTPVATPVTSTPTIAPYNTNANQQQVLWDFGAYALPAAGTLTLTFTAKVGATMPVGLYNNTAMVEYTSPVGPGSTNTGGTAAINLTNTPSITLLKTVQVFSDPVNGTTNPKFIPGAVALYTIIASNSGGSADADSIAITDPLPTNTSMFVNDLATAGSGPVAFTQGATSSGLTYSYIATAPGNATDDLDFFGGLPTPAWGYIPVPSVVDGCDPLVSQVRVKPKGVFVGNVAIPNPSFTLQFRVCVK